MKKETRRILTASLLSALLSAVVVFAAVVNWRIGMTARIVTAPSLKVLTLDMQVLTQIDWGDFGPGDTKTYSFYVLNNGTGTCALNLTFGADMASYLKGPDGFLTWDSEGKVLGPNTSCGATLTWHMGTGITSDTSVTTEIYINALKV